MESGTALDLMSNTTSTSDYVSKTHANTREEHVKHTYHFIRNIRSPHESVAPMIFSGSSPLSKPRATRMSSCRTIKTGCVFIGNKQIPEFVTVISESSAQRPGTQTGASRSPNAAVDL